MKGNTSNNCLTENSIHKQRKQALKALEVAKEACKNKKVKFVKQGITSEQLKK